MRRFWKLLALLAAIAFVAAACGSDDDEAATGNGDGDTTGTTADEGTEPEESGGTLTIYSGRSEELVGPLLEQFTEATGIEVEARYGDTAEMAALILEEGGASPADVFFGQDAGALGALSQAGLLAELSDDQLGSVEPAYESVDGTWIGVSGRARVVSYDTSELTEADLPESILDFTDPAWSGRIGWAPTNGSFQAFVTALRILEGEDGARAWLEGIQANQPVVYENNTSAVQGVADGEVDVAFVNHYYLYRFLAEDPAFPVANKIYGGGDPGGLVNIAGVGIVASTDQADLASQFVDYLLSADAQTYFAEETFEVPLTAAVEPVEGVPSFSDLTAPDLDLNQLEDLEGTLVLLTELGIL